MTEATVIHWFRQDLRLSDNPALCAAVKAGKVLPIYILDDENAGEFAIGAANRWWLHHSLHALDASLEGRLRVFSGKADEVLPKLVEQVGAKAVFWNRCYEPWRIARDKAIKASLEASNVEVGTFNGSLLWEPWEVSKKDGTPYRVFTPYYRKGCLEKDAPREPLKKPDIEFADVEVGDEIDALNLLPRIPWGETLKPHWEIGESGAHQKLAAFLDEGIRDYKEGRNIVAKKNVSRLSPYLQTGEISPNQVWHAVQFLEQNQHTDHFCSELGWREFSYHLLYHFPELPKKNLQPKYDAFPWDKNDAFLAAWQRGQTGYPIVDAGMRELYETGYMHGRVRMIVGSFLVKNLLLHWHHGEAWFWDCLVDADLASNSASWQWIAGSGADAAPYFRVFNPVLQGQKFDKQGDYTRRYVPELRDVPDKYLFCPWDASEMELKMAGVTLGVDYPKPIVDVKLSRDRALEAFASLKASSA